MADQAPKPPHSTILPTRCIRVVLSTCHLDFSPTNSVVGDLVVRSQHCHGPPPRPVGAPPASTFDRPRVLGDGEPARGPYRVDVHTDSVLTALRLVRDGAARTEVRSFGTTTPAFLKLSTWSDEAGRTHVAIEVTGVHWKPVRHVQSDAEVTPILANALHVKNVPGRKTDLADAP